MTASEFVRSQLPPRLEDWPTIEEIFAEAEKEGITISRGLVHQIRSLERRKLEASGQERPSPKPKPPRESLSPLQEELLGFCTKFIRVNKRGPTGAEAAAELGRHQASIAAALQVLRQRALIDFEPGNYRGMQILAGDPTVSQRSVAPRERDKRKPKHTPKRGRGKSMRSPPDAFISRLHRYLTDYMTTHDQGPHGAEEIARGMGLPLTRVTLSQINKDVARLHARKIITKSFRNYSSLRLLQPWKEDSSPMPDQRPKAALNGSGHHPALPPRPVMPTVNLTGPSYMPQLKADLKHAIGDRVVAGASAEEIQQMGALVTLVILLLEPKPEPPAESTAKPEAP